MEDNKLDEIIEKIDDIEEVNEEKEEIINELEKAIESGEEITDTLGTRLDMSVLLSKATESSSMEANELLEEGTEQKYSLNLTLDEISEYYEYLAAKRSRPEFADKFFADADSRIKESNQISLIMSLSLVPKLLVAQNKLVNEVTNTAEYTYKTMDEKIELLKSLNKISSDIHQSALKYTQTVRDLSSMPIIYRKLVDEMLQIPGEKLARLKCITKLTELSDETWGRIEEIMNLEK